MYTIADLVLIEAITNLHVGVGRAGGVVDVPIQRDELGYPCIYSSSLKGALKTALLYAFAKINDGNYGRARKAVTALLGSEPEEEEKFESSIAILDAYLLTIPVRSLKGIYAYVTSPLLLRRFLERINLCLNITQSKNNKELGKLQEEIRAVLENDKVKGLGVDNAVCVGDCSEVVITQDQPESLREKVVLAEEFILKIGNLQSSLKDELKLDKSLLILHDDIAKEVINRSLVRLTRVRLSRETKTVEEGPWTEEYIPVKTRMHTLFLYKRPPLSFTKSIVKRSESKDEQEAYEKYLEALSKLKFLNKNDIEELRKLFSSSPRDLENIEVSLTEKIEKNLVVIMNNVLKSFVIVGGKETIGKGIIKLTILGHGG